MKGWVNSYHVRTSPNLFCVFYVVPRGRQIAAPTNHTLQLKLYLPLTQVLTLPSGSVTVQPVPTGTSTFKVKLPFSSCHAEEAVP